MLTEGLLLWSRFGQSLGLLWTLRKKYKNCFGLLWTLRALLWTLAKLVKTRVCVCACVQSSPKL